MYVYTDLCTYVPRVKGRVGWFGFAELCQALQCPSHFNFHRLA